MINSKSQHWTCFGPSTIQTFPPYSLYYLLLIFLQNFNWSFPRCFFLIKIIELFSDFKLISMYYK